MKGSVAAFVVALERFVAAHPDHRGPRGPAADLGRGGRCHRRRAPGGRRVPRARRAHRLVHHRRAFVEGEAGRPAARRPPRHAVGDADRARHPGPRRLSGEGAQSDPPGDAGAGRAVPRGAGTTATRRSRRPASRSATSTPAPAPTTSFPASCEVLFNLRYNPSWRAAQLEQRMRGGAASRTGWSTTCTGIAAASRSTRRKARCARRRARCWRRFAGAHAGRKHRRRHLRCALHRAARRAVHRDRAGQRQHPQGRRARRRSPTCEALPDLYQALIERIAARGLGPVVTAPFRCIPWAGPRPIAVVGRGRPRACGSSSGR